jgi:hypothetical protein
MRVVGSWAVLITCVKGPYVYVAIRDERMVDWDATHGSKTRVLNSKRKAGNAKRAFRLILGSTNPFASALSETRTFKMTAETKDSSPTPSSSMAGVPAGQIMVEMEPVAKGEGKESSFAKAQSNVGSGMRVTFKVVMREAGVRVALNLTWQCSVRISWLTPRLACQPKVAHCWEKGLGRQISVCGWLFMRHRQAYLQLPVTPLPRSSSEG